MKFALFGISALLFVASAFAIDGSISVYNSGGYIARFNVDYDLNGQRQSKDSGKFSLGVTKEIMIPDGATNVYVKVQEYWFPGSLSTIFTASFSGPVQKCYKVWGTTLNPKYAEISC